MKKYFLHNGSESSGPFDIEELKVKKINKSTPVWFDGMEHWKTAEEIPELTSVFKVIPPPFKPTTNKAPNRKIEKNQEEQKILGFSKNTFFIISGVLILAIGTTVFNYIEDSRRRELEIKNNKTAVENQQYLLQQKEIEEQKILLEEQQQKEAERLLIEKKETQNNRIAEIQELVAEKTAAIELLKSKLKDTSSFKMLRTPEEKKVQLDLLESEIESLNNEIVILKNESDRLKLELEKIESTSSE